MPEFVRAVRLLNSYMNEKIHKALPKLLDAYLEDLQAEADTVTHIVKFVNDSTEVRADLAEKLKANLRALQDKSAATKASGLTRDLAQIQH